MKNYRKILAVLLALSMCLSVCAFADGSYTPGTYTGTSSGHDAGISVTVTVDASSIIDVEVEVSNETPTIGAVQGDALKAQILEAQSADIDGVSGATETSQGVIRALTAALNAASGTEAEKAAVADGTFSGTAPGFGITGMMTCDVTFENGAITDIKVVEETDSLTGEWFANAEELLIPRILEAQSLGVDSITGATGSSAGIKSAVAAAIDAAGGNGNDWYTEVEKTDATVILKDYDVIVVGLGGSGVLSYCAAANQGAAVFGLEAAGKIGGDSVCTYGPMALNSRYLKDLFTNGEDYINPDDVYNVWIDYVESEDKADVIKEAVYMSGDSLDYYVDNFGFEFEGRGLLGSFVMPEWTAEWCVYSPDPELGWNILGPNKTFQFTRAMDKALAMNEKNDYMCELTAQDLIFDAEGNVIGVYATYYDGTVYEIYGDSVILATGGFVGNGEMMTEVFGSPVNVMGVTVNKGDGIRMGISAGGATYALKTLPMIHINQVKNLIRTDDLTGDQKAILSALAITNDVPAINTNGETWDPATNIIFAPNFMFYNLYTQADVDNIAANGLSEKQSASTSQFLKQGNLPEFGTPVADIEEILNVGEKYDDVIIAGSIAELAEKLGCDEAVLSESLGGVDTKYYAVANAGWSYATVGGLDVDVNMNVLTEAGEPIINLFAVGQDSEGVCNVDGKAYSPWGGQAQSWTFVSGQIAGTFAAQYGLAQ